MLRFISLSVIAGLTLVSHTLAQTGTLGCPCITEAKIQTSAAGAPAYVDNTEYGYGCNAHDAGEDVCGTATDTGIG